MDDSAADLGGAVGAEGWGGSTGGSEPPGRGRIPRGKAARAPEDTGGMQDVTPHRDGRGVSRPPPM